MLAVGRLLASVRRRVANALVVLGNALRPTATEPTWKTRDGRVLLVREMEDLHLVNTINYLRRRHTTKLDLLGVEDDWASPFDHEDEGFVPPPSVVVRLPLPPVFEALVSEAQRRGLPA